MSICKITKLILFATLMILTHTNSYSVGTKLIQMQSKLDYDEADAEELRSGDMRLMSTAISLTSPNGRWSALTFSPEIPPKANIHNVYIQFSAAKSNDEKTQVVIFAEKNDRPGLIKQEKKNLSRRPRTAQKVNWNVPPWVVTDSGKDQRTPNLKNILQELVNMPYWDEQSDVVFLITGQGNRQLVTFDQNPKKAAVLFIEYSISSTPQNRP